MISVIICSANVKFLESATENIAATIGVPFELLVFENSGAKKGITEVYNEAAKLAKFEILCYMHEDLNILTQNWGNKVLDIFKNNAQVGIVGVAGSTYKSITPSGWAVAAHGLDMIRCNYIQAYKRSIEPSFHYVLNSDASDLAEVVCVDGLWFCTPKSVALQYGFDQDLFKGFHCYDLDYCFNVNQNLTIVVTYDILMEHFSEGGYDREWIEETLKLHQKWAKILPRSVSPVSSHEREFIEKRSFHWMIEKMIALKYPLITITLFLNRYRKLGDLTTIGFFKLLLHMTKHSMKQH
jgi:hypothetical protein